MTNVYNFDSDNRGIWYLQYLGEGTHIENITTNIKKEENFEYEKFKDLPDSKLNPYSKIANRGIYDTDFKFYDSGNKAFAELFADLEAAKEHIHINYYIIKPGEIYDQFKDILIRKASEGVEVRLIVDDFGRWAMPTYETKDLIKHGIQVQIFGKVYFPFIHSANAYRTHRKIVIIDSNIAHVGGINISDEYASLSSYYGKWVDLQAKIRGEAITSHALLFIEDWNQMTSEFLSPDKYIRNSTPGISKTVLLEDSPEIKENILHDVLLDMISNAKKSVLISTPYFVPSLRLIDALKLSVSKGVDVKIYGPGIHDKKIAWNVSNYYINELMEFGVKFYRTKNIFLHTKAGVFDNEIAYFGTANIDKRTFYQQFEFINIFEGQAVESLSYIFKTYDRISYQVKNQKKPKLFKKFIIRFFVNLFSPLI